MLHPIPLPRHHLRSASPLPYACRRYRSGRALPVARRANPRKSAVPMRSLPRGTPWTTSTSPDLCKAELHASALAPTRLLSDCVQHTVGLQAFFLLPCTSSFPAPTARTLTPLARNERVACLTVSIPSLPFGRNKLRPSRGFGPVAGTRCRSSPRNRVTKSRTRRCQRSISGLSVKM